MLKGTKSRKIDTYVASTKERERISVWRGFFRPPPPCKIGLIFKICLLWFSEPHVDVLRHQRRCGVPVGHGQAQSTHIRWGQRPNARQTFS